MKCILNRGAGALTVGQKAALCEEDDVRCNPAVVSTFIEQFALSLNYIWKLLAKTSRCINGRGVKIKDARWSVCVLDVARLVEVMVWTNQLVVTSRLLAKPTLWKQPAVLLCVLKLIWVAAHWFVGGRSSDTGHEPEAPVTPAELGSANFLVITSMEISPLAT